MIVYDFDSILPEGRYKGKTVREVFEKNKSSIFSLIKKYGYSFSDSVLMEAHITKTVHNRNSFYELEHHSPASARKLRKDTKTLDEILDEMDDERVRIKEKKDPIAIGEETENNEKESPEGKNNE